MDALRQHGWKQSKGKGKGLPKRLDYYGVFRLARCLEIQLKALEDLEQPQSFLFLTADDIREVGPGWYLIEDMSHLVPVRRDHITILTPNEKVKGAPELAKDLTLPHVAHKSCLYYHIGKLLVELLNVDADADGELERLYGSPLYFTIKRALERDPAKRHFLVV